MKGSTKRKWKESLQCYSLVLYSLILFCIFFFTTNISSILLAFQKVNPDGSTSLVGWSNFKEFFQQFSADKGMMGYAVKNALIIYVVTFVVGFIMQIALSYLIFKECYMGKLMRGLTMIPSMMSGLIVSLIFFRFVNGTALSPAPIESLFKHFHFIDQDATLNLFSEKNAMKTVLFYLIWFGNANGLMMIPTAMNGVNSEIFESAKIDGCVNMFQELFYIIIPLIYPTLTTFWVTSFAGVFMSVGPLFEFWPNGDVPTTVYTMGYYLTSKLTQTNGAVDQSAFGVYAAAGLVLTLIWGPATFLFKWFVEKLGPQEE